jgi:pSer/pThr/pTyr-binding forkhead associated (FHA) protein
MCIPTLEVSCYRLNGSEQICCPVEIKGGSFTIGRRASNDYVISGDCLRVSRHQCTIIHDGGTMWTVTDGGSDRSCNGTLLNGKILDTSSLRNGDVIEFPARPLNCEKIWRWRFTFRIGDPHETIESSAQEDTLILQYNANGLVL